MCTHSRLHKFAVGKHAKTHPCTLAHTARRGMRPLGMERGDEVRRRGVHLDCLKGGGAGQVLELQRDGGGCGGSPYSVRAMRTRHSRMWICNAGATVPCWVCRHMIRTAAPTYSRFRYMTITVAKDIQR